MANEFLSGIQTGANLQSLAWARQQRMMELQAQQAHQAIQERYYAAQAQMMSAHSDLYRQQMQKLKDQEEQDTADRLAMADKYAQVYNETGDHETAFAETILPAAAVNPRVAGEAMRGYAAWKTSQARTNRPEFQPSIESVTNPETGEKTPVLRTSPNSVQPMVQRPKDAASMALAQESAKTRQTREARLAEVNIQNILAKDSTLTQLNDDLKTFKSRLGTLQDEKKKWRVQRPFRSSTNIDEDIKSAQEDIDATQRQIKAREDDIRRRFAAPKEEAGDSEEQEGVLEPAEASAPAGKRYRWANGKMVEVK